ncbi:MAG: SAF domain-containing protein, partial [Bacteroidetes bacterium]|nr:SAF domain-containing protein [Bacteroidota bacterium]
MKPQFLFHDNKDNVGVAVVEIKAGEKIVGSCLEDGKQLTLEAKEAIPLGHKVALSTMKNGESVINDGVSRATWTRLQTGDKGKCNVTVSPASGA